MEYQFVIVVTILSIYIIILQSQVANAANHL